MTKEETGRHWYKQSKAEFEHDEIRKHYYRRAIIGANNTEINPYYKYCHDCDDSIRAIEKHGSLKGYKF